jgi:hypothetical protein
MRLTRTFGRTIAAAAVVAFCFTAAAPANAAVTVTLTPATATTGTTVTVIAAGCDDKQPTALVENTSTSVSMQVKDKQAMGTFVVPSDWKAGTYTVEVRCGDDKASATLTVTTGGGAATGSGSTATDPATAIALTGAAAVAVALGGLWLLKRRGKVAA